MEAKLSDHDVERLHNMAASFARRFARHECPAEMAKDLVQAAWLRILQLKKPDYLWKDLEWAMLEEISRWIYGCKRGRGKNRVLRYKQSFEDYCLIRNKSVKIGKVLCA